jgi:MFS family permease
VTTLAFGVPYSLPLYVVSALALGFATQATKVCIDAIIQEGVDDDYRGRAFAIYDAGANTCFAGAAVVGAITLPVTGRSPTTLVVMSALYALLAVTYWAATRHDLYNDSAAGATDSLHRSKATTP